MTKKQSAPPTGIGEGAEIDNQQARSLPPKTVPVKSRPRFTRRGKGFRPRAARQLQYLYDGRDLLAVIELRTDGRCHVLMHGRDDVGTAFATREMAIAFVNARRARRDRMLAVAPLAAEHIADAKRVNRIRMHQSAAEVQRERNSHSQPRRRGRMTGSKEKLLPAGNKPEGTGSRETTGQDGDRQRQ
jgi:hypothetical protein